MKRILILFLMYFCMTSLHAGGKFYMASTLNSVLENVIDNKLIATPLVFNQTYDCHNNAYVIINTNSESIISFSNDVILKLTENSKLNIESFEQTFENINNLPEIAKPNTINFNLSVYGSAHFVVKSQFTETNPMIISTSLANIVVTKASKFIIKAEEKSLLLIVLDGECIVFDNLSKRQQSVKEKQMTVVVPAPKLYGKATTMLKPQNMFSLKTLDDNEYKELNIDLTALSDLQSTIKFIVVNKDVVGVKIH